MSTSGQAPSQASSKKRRKLVPTIDTDMLTPLHRFSDILAEMDSDDPVVRSCAVKYVIRRLQTSEYHTIDNSEASVRVVAELLILERLHHLSNKGSLDYLQLYAEVDVNLLRGNTYITGHADWLLCHDDPRYGIDSTLIAIEAKRSCELSSASGQMATYLAAMQDRRTCFRAADT
ncbi:hypothetical protein N7494_000158 [Penicillium frequentans]|uniref:Uncharacterized protein n=1 Tax=Penicillium frequentans TaxID=3151616 RepID=A0AAD6D6F8_9EURO|nr:hypothetical protein N7494_000158 [Penicillium glabrum]